MNHPDFTRLRCLIDEAITFHDLEAAGNFIAQGLRMAEEKECPGETMYFKAQFEIVHERFKEAIGWLNKALQFNPTDGAAYNDMALCRVELGDIEGVLGLFDKGIAVEPDYATVHHNKGWFLNKLGKHQEALACFHRALELDPGRAVTYENMADAYESLGRMDEALGAYRESLRLIRAKSAQIRRQIEEEIKRLEKG